jgi:hypothetical protein
LRLATPRWECRTDTSRGGPHAQVPVWGLFALGDSDVYVVVDLPDAVAATAVALAVNASGAVAVKTVVLLTPEEVDAAAQRSVDYRPPGA